MYKISFYVPETHLEEVKNALFAHGAGKVGLYSCCAWQCLGEGQFMPLSGSKAFIGEQNRLEKVAEYKVEMICQDHIIHEVVKAFKKAHPYEEPAFDVIRVEEFLGGWLMQTSRPSSPSAKNQLRQLKIITNELVRAAPQESTQVISAELLQKMERQLSDLNRLAAELEAKRDSCKETLALCQLHLAVLHCSCSRIFAQGKKDNTLRILSAFIYCMSTLALAKEIQDAKIKKALIVQANQLLLSLLKELQVLPATQALPQESISLMLHAVSSIFYESLKGMAVSSPLYESLMGLAVTPTLSTTQRIKDFTKESLVSLESRAKFSTKSLLVFGGRVGFQIAQQANPPESLIDSMTLSGVVGLSGHYIGQALSDSLREERQPGCLSQGRFNLFKKPLAFLGGALGLYLALNSGTLLASSGLRFAQISFLTAMWGTCGYRVGQQLEARVRRAAL